jgi:outer membrane protein
MAARAEALVRSARATLLSTEQEVLRAAGAGHAAALRDRAAVELGIGHVSSLERRLRATRERFDRGEASRTDLAHVEARHARALAELRQAEFALAASQARYERVTGLPPP